MLDFLEGVALRFAAFGAVSYPLPLSVRSVVPMDVLLDGHVTLLVVPRLIGQSHMSLFLYSYIVIYVSNTNLEPCHFPGFKFCL